ncbi:hypothetical protein [Nocardia harenae]|uniref:hypothetical protein n=1 Tax=Nocardia harenae TaxID=358707 RepID=UPI000833178E|nr:hypothetical protein [Nocardia harenae]
MNDDTRPTSTEPSAGTFQEARFRADYLHSLACYPVDPAEYDPADSLDAAEYASPWMNSGDWQERDWVAEWVYLGEASERWYRNPAAAAAHAAKHADELTPVQRRSEAQARYLAEQGLARDRHGHATGPYVEAVEQRGDIAHAPHDRYLYRYADRVADDQEVLMRADYDRVQDLHAESRLVGTLTEHNRLAESAEAIETHWTGRGNDMSRAWRDLDNARSQWQTHPEMSRWDLDRYETAHARGGSGRFTAMQRRNQLHAREITGHGEWTVDAPSTDPGRAPKSALASHRSRNALAIGAANERDGAER